MIRINYDALEIENNTYYYENQLFSGIAFHIQNHIVVDRFICQDGVMTGIYHSLCFPSQASDFWVDYNALVGEKHEDSEPFLFEGVRYTGMACEIDGDFCVREFQFVNGRTIGEAEFFYSGNLESYGFYHEKLSQDYEWYKNGSLKSVQLQAVDEFMVEFKFSENQELNYIDIDGKYFETINRYKSYLNFPFYIDKTDFFDDIILGKNIFLASEGFVDRVVDELKKCRGFYNLKSISLFHTSLSTETIQFLSELPELEEIVIDDSRNGIEVEANRIKRQREECKVVFNDEKII